MATAGSSQACQKTHVFLFSLLGIFAFPSALLFCMICQHFLVPSHPYACFQYSFFLVPNFLPNVLLLLWMCLQQAPSECLCFIFEQLISRHINSLAGNLFSSSKRSLRLDVDSFCLPLRQFSLGSLGSLSSAFVEIKRQTTMLITSNMAHI